MHTSAPGACNRRFDTGATRARRLIVRQLGSLLRVRPRLAHDAQASGEMVQAQRDIGRRQMCREIDRLIAHHLDEVCHDETGWFILFRDRRDGRLWELSFPQSHMHGGGPPQLTTVDVAEARSRFGDWVL
jgi:hypothetical protein